MKRLVSIFLIFVLFSALTNFSVFAEQVSHAVPAADQGCIQLLRAGGGGDSGGGSGGSGGSGGGSGDSGGFSGGSSSGRYNTSRRRSGISSIISDILFIAGFVFITCGTAIIFRFKLSKYARNTKKLMRSLQKENRTWSYKDIQKRVEDTYFIVQKSWTDLNMEPARDYMSEELYDSFKTKLAWMEYRKQQNVLENIQLLKAMPVSVHNNENDSLDHVWFYIKGRMVDYTIDTRTNEKISGNTFAQSFAEYWQFVCNSDGCWVLNKILQKNETDKIVFTE